MSLYEFWQLLFDVWKPNTSHINIVTGDSALPCSRSLQTIAIAIICRRFRTQTILLFFKAARTGTGSHGGCHRRDQMWSKEHKRHENRKKNERENHICRNFWNVCNRLESFKFTRRLWHRCCIYSPSRPILNGNPFLSINAYAINKSLHFLALRYYHHFSCIALHLSTVSSTRDKSWRN